MQNQLDPYLQIFSSGVVSCKNSKRFFYRENLAKYRGNKVFFDVISKQQISVY